MVKKMLPVLLMLLLLPVMAMADVQVIDDAHLFSAADVQRMQEIIEAVEKEHAIDLVVLTTNDVPYDYSESMYRVRDYADDFYDNGGYGKGDDFSGMLILLDMNNRVMWLSTGGVMIDYITDYREEIILDDAGYYLSAGRYGSAIIAALQRIEKYMDAGREEGTFRYDEATGQRIGGIYNALTKLEMMIAAGAGVAVALVVFLSVNGSYNLTGNTYSYDRRTNTSLVLTKDEESYLRQFVNRIPINRGGGSGGGGRSGGSGVHRSSGGRSHGGGGRRF